MSTNIQCNDLRSKSNINLDGNISATGFKLTTGAAAGKVLRSDSDGDATWEDPGLLPNVNNVFGWQGDTDTYIERDSADVIHAVAGSVPALFIQNVGGVSGHVIANGLLETNTLKVTSSPTSGHVLTSDASGNATWQAPSGGLPSSIQVDATVTAVGVDAFANPSGASFCVAFGQNTLNQITSGDRVTAIGYNALAATTSASNNTAVGAQALSSNTTGGFNTAIGTYVLQSLTIGSSNVAVGYEAMSASISTAGNTAVGTNCLSNLTTGHNNTCVGKDSGGVITTGTHNVCVGYNAKLTNTTDFGNTVIGAGAVVNGSELFAIGLGNVTKFVSGLNPVAATATGTDYYIEAFIEGGTYRIPLYRQ